MVVANSVYRDPRVVREARALSAAGHRVVVAGIVEGDAANVELSGPENFEVQCFEGVWLKRIRKLARRVKRGLGRGNATGPPKAVGCRRVLATLNAALLFKGVENVFFRALPFLLATRADAVHAHDLNTLRPAVRIGRKLGVPVVYDSHEVWPDMGNFHSSYKHWLIGIERRCIQKSVRAVVTVSDGIAELFVKRYKVACPTVVINAPYTSNVTPRFVRNSEITRPIFLYQGALVPGRGLESVVEAFRYVRTPGRLKIRGTGPLWNRLSAMAAEIPSSRVQMLCAVPPDEVVRSAARDGDIGVVPFTTDSLNHRLALPNKLFEYFAAGLAVFSTNIPEVRGLLERFRAGWVYTCENPRMIAQAVDAIVRTGGISVVQRNARWAHSTELNWQNASRVLIKMYDEI